MKKKIPIFFAMLFFWPPSYGEEMNQRKPGLVAHYYKDSMYWGGHWTAAFPPKVPPEQWIFTDYQYTRVEPVVNHRFPLRSWFSVRWYGSIMIDGKLGTTPERISFGLKSRHGCRLRINGKTIVSGWKKTEGGDMITWGETILAPGRYSIHVEAFFGKNRDIKKGLPLALLWKSDEMGIKEAVVPKSVLSHTARDLVPPESPKTPKPKNN